MRHYIQQARVCFSVLHMPMLLLFFLSLEPWTIADVDSKKSGVAPQVLSLPSGPGAVEGLGESFEPQLNSGTASYAVPLKAAPGRAGFAPQLVLRYNGGWGNGTVGMGWRLDLPGIQRQTDKGLPRYDEGPDGDRFITIGGDELVLVETLEAGAVRVYREKNEATFAKYLYYAGAQRWEILTTSGIKHALGACFDGTDAKARITHPDDASKVFLWSIAESVDPNGNTVRFTYHRDQQQVYCEAITYNGDGSEASGNAMKVAFTYEETRPDPVEDYRPTFRMVTAKRLIAVGIYENTRLVRRYDLTYHSDGEVSLLASVTQVGDDGASALPPASFTYTSLAFAAAPTLNPVSGLGGAYLLRDGQNGDAFPGAAQVIDFNADGLPDLYASKHGGSDLFEFDLFYRNLGKGRFERVALSEAESAGYPIQAQNSFLRDLTGNGRVDLIAQKGALSENFVYKTNEGGKWSAKEQAFLLSGGITAEHVFTGDEVRSADLDADKNIDSLRSLTTATASGTGVVFSAYFYRGGGRFEHVAQTMPDIVPGLSTTFAASNGRLLLSDMNGDRMLDLVLLNDATNGGVRWWPSLGRGRFEAVPGDRKMSGGPDYGGVNDQMGEWQVEDLNGDGYADLVRLSGYAMEIYLNRVGQGYRDKRTLSLGSYYNPEATAWRLVDLDGDGVLELLVCTAQQQFPDQMPARFHYVELFEGAKSFLLHTITNGIGLTTTVTYSSSVAEMVRAREAGTPWTQWAPFPVPVVVRTEAFDGVNAPYVTEITYHDGYYDGLEREFRGFAAAMRRELGDSSLPDLFTDHIFDTGAEHEVLKGKTLSFEARTAEKSGEGVFFQERNEWEPR
ncbi:MAG TPA: SpvB/TcaC N-terminal domain-containing protein, partial [Candidatus Hydrogenedentes bacterium]|nr:SpvB/TcaC N-terminal domain-containing protein [Candidatus Hydrogenedentota bacterium]